MEEHSAADAENEVMQDQGDAEKEPADSDHSWKGSRVRVQRKVQLPQVVWWGLRSGISGEGS